jgi:hypothetical protein
MPAEIWPSFQEVCILRRLEDLRTSVQRISAAKGISGPLVWRTIHEHSLYSYIRQLQALTPPDHCVRALFCQWLLAKCIIDTQFAANILFTDEVGFTRDGIVNFHNNPCLGG